MRFFELTGSAVLMAAFVLLSSIASCFVQQVSGAGIGGAPRELVALADQLDANLKAIATWKGIAEIVDTVEKDGKTTVVSTSVDFVYDSNGNRLSFKSVIVQPDEVYTSGAIRTRDSYARYGPAPEGYEGSEEFSNALVINKLDTEKSSVLSPDFDPFALFRVAHGSASKFLRSTYEHRDVDAFSAMNVTRKGAIVTIVHADDVSPWTYVFDHDQQGVPVSVVGGGGTDYVKTSWMTTYVRIDGVVLPSIMVYTNENSKTGARRERTIAMLNQSVNKPVDESRFDPMQVPLQPGDHIRDIRSGTETIVREDEFIRAVMARKRARESKP